MIVSWAVMGGDTVIYYLFIIQTCTCTRGIYCISFMALVVPEVLRLFICVEPCSIANI